MRLPPMIATRRGAMDNTLLASKVLSMTDRYTSFANSGPGRAIVKRLGLPDPTPLRRHRPGDPDIDGPVLVGGDGRLADAVRKLVPGGEADRYQGLVFDATGITDSGGLRALFDFFQ